jgi:glycosyltransferase involved in cell wall biosynthesis
MAAPYQVRFCEHFQRYFDTEFWFYEYMGDSRPEWWKLDLPPRCKIIGRLLWRKRERYLTLEVFHMLREFDPDILLLGGFFIPSNYLAYRWAKKRGRKVIVFTETFRRNGKLRERSIWTRFVELLYRNVDAVFTCAPAATHQLQGLFKRLGKVTHTARYSADIDRYFEHPVRKPKEGYTYIFPNRLIDQYAPRLAIEIFAEIQAKYPRSRLKMNAQGDLLGECRDMIGRNGIEAKVEFLDDIRHWDDLSRIYRECDILLLPAKFSNGNFTVLECMASGMGIVISNRIVGQMTMLKTGRNGFICDPDRAQFVHAVERYIREPDLFREHARANREFVRPLSGAGTAELYAKLIGENVDLNRIRRNAA